MITLLRGGLRRGLITPLSSLSAPLSTTSSVRSRALLPPAALSTTTSTTTTSTATTATTTTTSTATIAALFAAVAAGTSFALTEAHQDDTSQLLLATSPTSPPAWDTSRNGKERVPRVTTKRAYIYKEVTPDTRQRLQNNTVIVAGSTHPALAREIVHFLGVTLGKDLSSTVLCFPAFLFFPLSLSLCLEYLF